jgi:hypothetical protein
MESYKTLQFFKLTGSEVQARQQESPRERKEDERLHGLAEVYRPAVEYDRHLTTINWYIASIFVAGILGALGFVLSEYEFQSAILDHNCFHFRYLRNVDVVSFR